jgi:disulfide bond formation protein DsbB
MKFRLLAPLTLLIVGGILGSACGGSAPAPTPTPRGDAAAGQTQFVSTCSACHGPDAKGMPGLGKDLTTSEFAKGKTDDELVAFITKGRDPSDPLNTTGVAMPPRGGNPALDDEDLYDIVAFVRTLEK